MTSFLGLSEDDMALKRVSKAPQLEAIYKRQKNSKVLKELRLDGVFDPPPLKQCHYPDIVFVAGDSLGWLARKHLEQSLKGVRISPHKCFFTTLWKGPLAKGKIPNDDHYGRVLAYVEDEIAVLRPKVVVPVGQDATTAFLETEAVGSVHGTAYDWETHWLVPIMYPAIAECSKQDREELNYDLSVIELYVQKPRR